MRQLQPQQQALRACPCSKRVAFRPAAAQPVRAGRRAVHVRSNDDFVDPITGRHSCECLTGLGCSNAMTPHSQPACAISITHSICSVNSAAVGLRLSSVAAAAATAARGLLLTCNLSAHASLDMHCQQQGFHQKKCKKWSNLLSAFSLPVQHTACTRLANILMVDADCPAGEVITRTSVYNAAAG